MNDAREAGMLAIFEAKQAWLAERDALRTRLAAAEAALERARKLPDRIRLQASVVIRYSLDETPRTSKHGPTTMEISLSHFRDIADDLESALRARSQSPETKP